MKNIASSVYKGLFQTNKTPLLVFVRNTNRINVGKPRPSHYNRAKIEHLVAPRYFEKNERESWFIPLASKCMKEEELKWKKKDDTVENPYERLLAKELKNWFQSSKLIAFFHANPIKFDDRFEVEVKFRKENMYLKKYGRHTVKMALEGTPYISVMPLFTSHTDMVFCSEPNVDILMKITSKMHFHVLLAAIVEDRLLSVSQLKALSQLKDLTTARAQLVGVLNAAQSQLVSGLTYHQSNIVAGLQQYSEKSQQPSVVDTPPDETQTE